MSRFSGLILFCFPLIWSIISCSPDAPSSTRHSNIEVAIYGGSLNDKGQSIVKTSSGGYAILGYTQSLDGNVTDKINNSFDYWILNFDSNNNLLWNKTYGGTDEDRGNSIIETSDGGFAAVGFSKSSDGNTSTNNGQNDFWVLKLDDNGNILWEKAFGFSGADSGLSIIQTSDGGYLLCGILDVTASGGQGNSKSLARKHAGGDYWLIKLDTNGNKEWSRFYGGTFTDTPNDLIETTNNNYIIVGSSDSQDVDISSNKGSYDFWIIKISQTGTILWEKSFGGSLSDKAYAITSVDDDNFLVVGDTSSDNKDVSSNNGATDLWVIKISADGELIWEKTFGGSNFDVGRSISPSIDGNFIISGSSRSENGDLENNKGQNDAWVLKIDTNGNLLWQQSFGGSEIEFAQDAIQLNNSKIIVTGESRSANGDIPLNSGFQDLLIIEINE